MAKKNEKPRMAFNVASFKTAEKKEPVAVESDAAQKLTVVQVSTPATTPATVPAPAMEAFVGAGPEVPKEAPQEDEQKVKGGGVVLNKADKALSISSELSADDISMLKKGFPVRLSKQQIARFSQVFAESKFKSKQKMAEALLMDGVERLAKELNL